MRLLSPRLRDLAAAACLALGTHASHALDLREAHALAIAHDPTLRAAVHEREAAQALRDMGRAGLLPQLSYSYSRGRNDSTVRQDTTLGEVRSERRYDNYASTLQLEQPLLDRAAWARYQLGQSQADAGLARYRAQFQALAQRLLQAYTAALLARDRDTLAQRQVQAIDALLRQNQRLRALGEGTATDVLETEASLAAAQAERIEAADTLALALRELEAIVGQPVAAHALPALAETAQAQTLPLDWPDAEGWQQQALAANPQLQAQRLAVDAAGHEIARQQAGHWPRVSLYASHRRTDSDSENTYGQNYRTNTVGVRLTVPLYAGGGIAAQARQAAQSQAQAAAELDALAQQVSQDIARAWRRTSSAQAVIAARGQAVRHADEQVRATRLSVRGGERVNTDVLAAERQLHHARVQLAEARYTYLQAWLDLHLASGQFEPAHLDALDRQWAGAPAPASVQP